MIASSTIKCLSENVPQDVPGIAFLSGGQSDDDATNNLNEMNIQSQDNNWKLTFSYGRALQQAAMTFWSGKDENIESAKKMKFDLNAIFKNFDAIITPAAPGEAPRYLSTTGNAMFNGYWTMMGVPAISLPLLKGKNSLPIGVQVITSWKKDNLLLNISDTILKDYQ